jgi:hypothetical protein
MSKLLSMARNGHFGILRRPERADGTVPMIDISASRVTVVSTGVVFDLGVPTIEMALKLDSSPNISNAHIMIATS